MAMVAIASCCALLITACSSGPPVATSYLATSSNGVSFIQWNDFSGHLDGTATLVTVSGQPPEASTSTNSLSMTGTLAGSKLSLSFEGSALQFGVLSGTSFTIDVPQNDGTFALVTFTTASASEYNQAVHKLNDHVKNDDEEQAINGAAQVVGAGLSTLTQDVASISSAISPLDGQLQQEQKDLNTTASDATAAENQPGDTSCDPAITAENDAITVEDDANGIGTTSDTVETAIQGVPSDVTNLKSDLQHLLSAEAALPSYRTSVPTQSSVNVATTSASNAVAAAVQQTNAVISQANNYDNTAWHDVGSALQAENCGGAPAPAQIQPISS